MNHNLNIPDDFDNLEKYAPTLARIAKQNPFGVPDGYFDENNSFILSQAKLSALNKENGFTVPNNYFEELPDLILNKIFLLETKQEDVPEGYFNELPNIIQSKIFLDSLNKENAFEVPANYFEELADTIQSRISLETISKENPFLVPDGYFDELPTIIQSKAVAEKKQPIIISLFAKRFSYVAAAASVILIIGLSIFFNTHDTVVLKGEGFTAYSAPITRDDIKEYLRNNVDEATLMEYASNSTVVTNAQVKTEGIEKKDVENYFNDNNVDVTEL